MGGIVVGAPGAERLGAQEGVGSLVVWATAGHPPRTSPASAAQDLVLWQAFLPDDAPSGWVSLPSEVSRQADALRTQYLEWLHDVGSVLAPGMMRRPRLSAWWLTLPAEFPFEPSSRVAQAVRLMALDTLLHRYPPDRPVHAVGEDHDVLALIAACAGRHGRTVHVVRTGRPARPHGVRARISQAIAARPTLAALRVFAGHLRCLRRRAPQTLPGDGPLFIDYLAHLHPSARTSGVFASNYWGGLVDALATREPPARWLHISGRQASHRVLTEDRALTRAFDEAGPGRHALVHDWLTPGVLLGALADWRRQCRLWKAVRRTRIPGAPPLPQVALGALAESLTGKHGALNAIWLRCFERALGQIGDAPRTCYLMENQPWELAMLATWRDLGRGPIVGVAHSSVAPWNTRLFQDPRDLFQPHEWQMPWPDVVAVNGPLARRHFHAAGYPAGRTHDVEALRYLDMRRDGSPAGSTGHARPAHGLRIMVFGEYDAATTASMLELVRTVRSSLAEHLPETAITWRFRPHPAGEHSAALSKACGLTLHTQGSVADALAWADVAICGPLSTVVLESICAGRATAVLADPQVLDANPAHGLAGTVVVQRAEALSAALLAWHADTMPAAVPPDDIFFLDPGLPRWVQLLA